MHATLAAKCATMLTILERGASPNPPRKAFSIENGLGNPLEVAPSRGNVNIVQDLLNAGADPNIEESNALIKATHSNHAEIVWILIAARADLYALEMESGCARLVASILGYMDIVEMLLSAGADPNV